MTARSHRPTADCEPIQACSTTDSNDSATAQKIKNGAITIDVGDLEIERFEAYLDFLYRGLRTEHFHVDPYLSATTNAIQRGTRGAVHQTVEDAVDAEYMAICQLYVFCGRVQDLEARKVLLSALIKSTTKIWEDHFNYFPLANIVRLVYAEKSTIDPVRAFLVDCWAFRGEHSWVENEPAGSLPPQFLFDIMVAMLKYRVEPEDFSQIEDASYYCDMLQP